MAQGNITLMGKRMMREAVLHIGTMCLARGRCNATCGLRIVMYPYSSSTLEQCYRLTMALTGKCHTGSHEDYIMGAQK